MSYSRVDSYKSCKYKWFLNYIKELEVIPNTDPTNALYLGSAIHLGIEKDVDAAIDYYYSKYPVISDLHINEAIKLEYLIPKVKELLPSGEYEKVIVDKDKFIGFTDLLVPKGNNHFDLYDFKYSNNIDSYMDSKQLHIYKYYIEKTTDKIIDDMYYVFIPKTSIRQRNTEELTEFRNRIINILDGAEISIKKVEYNKDKVINYFEEVQEIYNDLDKSDIGIFTKTTKFCNWCDYKDLCEKGEDYMILPSVERRKIGENKKRKIWIYGASFTGKTTMLDKAPNPLNLNTDGNIEFVTMPYVPIKDIVTVEGRQTKRKFAWEVLKETIGELEKKQNDFKTIIIDLVEDTREMCRVYMYDKLGIAHESDSGYGKGWDMIKVEYLSLMRRFFNLDYENLIVVSHEIQSEVKKKSGQTITKIAPNLQEGIANKICGMVDVVGRVVVDDEGKRTLNFKSNEFIFGGGRLKDLKETQIDLDWDNLIAIYNNIVVDNKVDQPTQEPKQEEKDKPVAKQQDEVKEEPKKEEKTTRRSRKSRDTQQD